MRKRIDAESREYESHYGVRSGTWRVRTSGSGRTGRRAGSGIRGSARVLPCRGDADALERLGHQDRSVVAHLRLEWQVPGCGQWRVAGIDRVCGDGRSASTRVRDELYRHRSRRRKRQLRNGAPREGHRFRVSLRTRDDRERESDHQRVLRQRAKVLLLERMLGWWATGDEGSADVPERLRRDHCGLARPRLVGTDGAGGPHRAGAAEGRSTVHSREGAGAAHGGRQCVRRTRWLEGWSDRESRRVQVRSCGYSSARAAKSRRASRRRRSTRPS